MLAFHIGLESWWTVVIIRKGAYECRPLREGTQGKVARRDGADPGGRHDSYRHLRHGHGRHGQAGLSCTGLPAPGGREATRLPTASSIAARIFPRLGTSSRSVTSPPDGSGTRILRDALLAADDGTPEDGGADSRDGHGAPWPGGTRCIALEAAKAREPSRRLADLGPWARGFAVCDRRRRLAPPPHEARRHDPEGRGCQRSRPCRR